MGAGGAGRGSQTGWKGWAISMEGSCRPENHLIRLNDLCGIQVVVSDGQQRYIPVVWTEEPGMYVPLLPPGKVRLTVLEARNDCAAHVGLPTV